ncbi:hypothetical protein Pcinc_037297 [Petrolisthes cinctipes]|uniref:Uncharacterized protein n=1 Tax=Petrolisthes cinctipes TaxID=88211 RepID=A0AAE1BW92_PETCI|nr:hypothetical protein Pcinc_037297 [Petrolisthes cinctipes]
MEKMYLAQATIPPRVEGQARKGTCDNSGWPGGAKETHVGHASPSSSSKLLEGKEPCPGPWRWEEERMLFLVDCGGFYHHKLGCCFDNIQWSQYRVVLLFLWCYGSMRLIVTTTVPVEGFSISTNKFISKFWIIFSAIVVRTSQVRPLDLVLLQLQRHFMSSGAQGRMALYLLPPTRSREFS